MIALFLETWLKYYLFNGISMQTRFIDQKLAFNVLKLFYIPNMLIFLNLPIELKPSLAPIQFLPQLQPYPWIVVN